jgi:monothiol glutaredoxin
MKFKVVSPNVPPEQSTGADVQTRIQNLLRENPVFLFMKGTPEAPQCGFSYRVCEVLRSWDVPFRSFNVLSDPEIRQGIKDFAQWPTIPQLYIQQEFVGGCDIIEEISQNGELKGLLESAFPGQSFEPPPPPAQVQALAPSDAQQMMNDNEDLTLLDVRTLEEREYACIERSRLLDHKLAEEILNSWDPNTPLLLICHRGIRSLEAAQFFISRGFQQVYNVEGGIDRWSSDVDSSIPRY